MKLTEKLGLMGIIVTFTNVEAISSYVNEWIMAGILFIFVMMFLSSSDKTHSRKEKVVNPISN